MLELRPVDRRTGLTREEFANEYLAPGKPVVLTDLTADWPARERWTMEMFKVNYGHLRVPVVSNNYSKPGKSYLQADRVIAFEEFLEIIESGPTDLRIFLWNIFRAAPELRQDFRIPTIMDGFANDFPYMFFGGEGSKVGLHFDKDLGHVFLNQIHGRKRVVLFSPEMSDVLYRHPFTVASYVDVNRPDYARFPALRLAKGLETTLLPGETVFMPSGYWHCIEYTDGGYSMALRAFDSLGLRARGRALTSKNFLVDASLNKLFGNQWRALKERWAHRRAENAMRRAGA